MYCSVCIAVCNLRNMMDTPSIDWATDPLLSVAVCVAVGVTVGVAVCGLKCVLQ